MKCRHCEENLNLQFVNLGVTPPSNAYLCENDLASPETFYPLEVFVCEKCWLVQTKDFTDASSLFSKDYAYFSSVSTSWLKHARIYAEQMVRDLGLDKKSLVVEIASNDGYLLRNFVEFGIPCIGVEPTDSTAEVAEALGINVIRKFFGVQLAQEMISYGKKADLICGNNVYAHVPDINDFTAGLKALLSNNGTITLEFPHLMNLINKNQFDTIYHEHFSYLSLTAVSHIFSSHALKIFKVEELSTHGGSLRVYGCHNDLNRNIDNSVADLLKKEEDFGLLHSSTYSSFQNRINKIKNDFIEYLILQKRNNVSICGYGAAAKGNTLLNFAGIKPDLLPFVCDAALSKQGKYLPGCRIPIVAPSEIGVFNPEKILIFPWNLSSEIITQIRSDQRRNLTKFTVAVPALKEII